VGAPLVTPAILLRSIPYGEADRVVTLLGRTTGRLSAMARGARRSVRRFGGGLGLGARGEATLREPPHAELLSLQSFEVIDGRTGLGSDLGRTAHAGYAAELCDRLCPIRQPEPEVYDWLDLFLSLLEARGASAERTRTFELGLFGRLGLAPSLGACVACGLADLGEQVVRFDAERGGVVCGSCAQRGTLLFPAARRALQRLAACPLEDADRERMDRDLGSACRSAVWELVAVHVPGPLKSVEFLTKLQSASARGDGKPPAADS
jgi:DNA repair protein RecO (recombination protein O)